MLVHQGTGPGSRAYRMFDPRTQRIVVSRDVVFDETKGWNWIQSNSNRVNRAASRSSMRTSEIMVFFYIITRKNNPTDTETNQVIEINDEDEEETISHEQPDKKEKEQEEVEEITLRGSTRHSSKPKYLNDYVLFTKDEGEYLLMCVNNEPRDFYEAKESKKLMLACEDEITSITKNGTWTLVDLPHEA